MTPLTICCFKWKPKGRYRSTFGPDTVLVLRNMVQRHYPHPHRFICVTDDDSGLNDVETLPLWNDFEDVPSPHGAHQPSCYRRLKLFSDEAKTLIGPRFVSVDLDTVIVGDMSTIWNRSEDFVCWGETNPKSHYNGSMFLLTAGARRKVWDEFDPKTSPQKAKSGGFFGSDQGHLSCVLGKGEATWTTSDGVYSYNVHLKPKGKTLPEDAKIVMFHGSVDPWMAEAQSLSWVREHYR